MAGWGAKRRGGCEAVDGGEMGINCLELAVLRNILLLNAGCGEENYIYLYK